MRILIVDDESLNRFLLIHMLEEEGYTDVCEAENGEQALAVYEEQQPDLVLLDVVMPGMDGYEVARKLKANSGELYLPIIFITSLDDEDSLAKCLSVGGDDFVAKPFNRVILSAKIKAHSRTRILSKDTYQQNLELTYHQNNIEREHTIVEHIFKNVLTLDNELTQYIDFRTAPASNFNGDLLLIERSPNGGLYLLLGDFTGHGLASAIGALPVARAFQTMTAKCIPIGEMAETFNQILLDFLPGDMFFAAAVIEIGENGKVIDVWNGGLPHLIVVNEQGEITKRFESMHMALGILDAEDFETTVERYEAQYGETIFGYTDGVIELHDEQGNMLGEEGLEKWLMENPKLSPLELSKLAESYRASSEQDDDITVVSYRCQEITLTKHVVKAPNVPFNTRLEVNADLMKISNPVSEIIDMVSAHQAFHGVRSSIFTVLSELYTNALDHGILGLDSKLKEAEDGFFVYFEERENRLAGLSDAHISIDVAYKLNPPRLEFNLKDSGSGFDLANVDSIADSDKNSGRGIALVQELTDHFEYQEEGTRVIAIFNV